MTWLDLLGRMVAPIARTKRARSLAEEQGLAKGT
jgi:hypothetical protein